MKEHIFIVDQKFNNYKCKDYLKSIGVSKEIILKVKCGGITVNEKVLDNVNNALKTGDRVKIVLPKDQSNPFVKGIKGDLKIVYEDEYMLAVYKPSGMPTHNSKGNALVSLDQLVCGYFAPQEFTFRAVNRLDRDTSGIVLVAKDMLSCSLLGELVKRGEIKKTYLAVVDGVPKTDHFIIEKPIKREKEGSMKRVCDKDGKYAKTECFLEKQLENGLSLLKIILHTGRTHQIRVHLSDYGLPLFADALYGRAKKGKTFTLIANQLSFIHPFTNEQINLLLNTNIE